MGTVTNSIGSSGRDYSTLAAWAAALPANLVTDGNSYVGETYNDSLFTSASPLLTLSGHTTDSSHTITLTTGPGQSFRDNASVQTNALAWNQANGVALKLTSNYNGAVIVDDERVTVSGLQVWADGNFSDGMIVNGANGIAENDILLAGSGGTVTNPGMAYFGNQSIARNCLMISTTSGATGASSIVGFNDGGALYFCTIVMPSDVASPVPHAVHSNYFTATLENCAVFGAAAVFSGSTISATNCMTDVASPPTGFTTVAYADQFEDTTSAAMDYRLKALADLIGAGTADATNGAFDIAGTARPQGSDWDGGCWEYLASGPPPTVTLRNLMLLGAGDD